MTTATETLHDQARRLWQNEGGHCVSSLVHTLAGAYGAGVPGEPGDLADLAEQAFELSTPIDDWESAARDNGYMRAENGEWYGTGTIEQELEDGLSGWDDVATLCWDNGIEPYQREVYEHWIVSDWLADQLAERGEKVDKDFAGLTIWARTTTGQAVYADWVIEDIARSLHA